MSFACQELFSSFFEVFRGSTWFVSYAVLRPVISDSLTILPPFALCVKHFFNFFKVFILHNEQCLCGKLCYLRQLDYITTLSPSCQHLFLIFFKEFYLFFSYIIYKGSFFFIQRFIPSFLHFFFTISLILLTNLCQTNIIALVPIGTSFFIYLT